MIAIYLFIALVIGQRLMELRLAKKNERWMKAQGGYEKGEKHYPYIVAIHTLFFLSLLLEVTFSWTEDSTWNIIPLLLFLIIQWGRMWVISSLGKFWNTKIIVLPGAKVVRKGPYRYFRHPNYVIVIMEMMTLPLIFHAYWTAIIFTLSCAVVLFIRIREEEAALKEATNYEAVFFNKSIRDERKWT